MKQDLVCNGLQLTLRKTDWLNFKSKQQ
jgi:hypothetical protein